MIKWLLGATGGGIVLSSVFCLFLFPLSVRPTLPASCSVSGNVAAPNLDAEAAKNAATIIGVAMSRKLPPRASIIAIATAMQESGLHNVTHGDAAGPDSLGLFQQRASWSPASVRLYPAGAAGLFFDALVKVGSWETRPLADVAHEVQKFQDGLRPKYAANEAPATAIVSGFQLTSNSCASSGGPAGSGLPGNPFLGCKPALTQGYGPTTFAVEPQVGPYLHFHTGIDLSCPERTEVLSRTAGRASEVVSSCADGYSPCGGGWGNTVVVESTFSLPNLPQGHYFVRYAHLLTVAVSQGVNVNAGDPIGQEGTSGYSTGPHVHLELDKDHSGVCCSVNPQPLLGG